jgi:hypothetical protein
VVRVNNSPTAAAQWEWDGEEGQGRRRYEGVTPQHHGRAPGGPSTGGGSVADGGGSRCEVAGVAPCTTLVLPFLLSPSATQVCTVLRCRRGGGAGVSALRVSVGHARGIEVVLQAVPGHPSSVGFAEVTGSQELPQVAFGGTMPRLDGVGWANGGGWQPRVVVARWWC